MATSGSFEAQQRRERLLGALDADGMVRVDRAARELGVSEMTVRRDLAELEQAGAVRRVRGGAVAAPAPRSFAERAATQAAAKAVIARKALPLVPASGAVGVDASSTAARLVALAGPRPGLVVVTNSYDTLVAARAAGTGAVLVGGELDERTGSFTGPVACRAAASMGYARFFCSAAAVDAARGTSEVSLAEAEVKLAFAGGAAETVLCATAAKLDQLAFAVALGWERIGVLVTELDPGDERLDAYRGLAELL